MPGSRLPGGVGVGAVDPGMESTSQTHAQTVAQHADTVAEASCELADAAAAGTWTPTAARTSLRHRDPRRGAADREPEAIGMASRPDDTADPIGPRVYTRGPMLRGRGT